MRSGTLILVCLFACSNKAADQAKPETKAVETPAPAAVQARKPDPTPNPNASGMMSQLKYEAEHRPKVGVTAEQTFDALGPVGFKLDTRKQYMGKTMGAAFCAGAKTEDKITVSVCEYADDKAAQQSLDYMNSHFGQLPAKRAMHHAAVITVVDSTPNDPRVDKAIQTFMAL